MDGGERGMEPHGPKIVDVERKGTKNQEGPRQTRSSATSYQKIRHKYLY